MGADCNCSDKSSRRRQEAWENFCEKFELSAHQPPQPTFHHHNGLSESFLDIFVASSTLSIQSIVQYCTLADPMSLSSHDPIVTATNVSLDICNTSSKYADTYTKFERRKIIWDETRHPEYQKLASQALSAALNYWSSPESLPHLSSLVSKLLVTCATLVYDSTSSKRLSCSKKPPLKIRQAQNFLKKTFEAWKKAGKPGCADHPARAAYCMARSNLQKLRRHAENLAKIKENNYLMNLHQNRSKIFKYMKKRHGHNHNTMTSILHTPVGTYSNEDVLEGFAADTEFLGKTNEDSKTFDQGFYKLCKLENIYIFDFLCEEPLKIPPMTLAQLDHILHAKMKPGKACDVYQVTVEHLRNCGNEAKLQILTLINRFLENLYFLSCPQIKLGLGSAVHKGKRKPLSRS